MFIGELFYFVGEHTETKQMNSVETRERDLTS